MTETFKKFKPLDDVFLLTEHTAKTDFANSALSSTESESALHKLLHGHGKPETHHEHLRHPLTVKIGNPPDQGADI